MSGGAAPSALWQELPCRLDAGLDAGAPVAVSAGLIVNAGDSRIEPDLRRFTAVPGGPPAAEIHATRIPFDPRITPGSLAAMGEGIEAATALLLPDERMEVVAFGCTSAAIAITPEGVARRIRRQRPQVAVTDPVSAALAALRALGLRRIALLTPYPQAVNRMVAEFLAAQGVAPVACGTFRAPESAALGRTPPGRVTPDSILAAALSLARGPVDGAFLSCTGLRTAGILARIEAGSGKPAVSSNQALAWHLLRLAGSRHRPEGLGSLFAQ